MVCHQELWRFSMDLVGADKRLEAGGFHEGIVHTCASSRSVGTLCLDGLHRPTIESSCLPQKKKKILSRFTQSYIDFFLKINSKLKGERNLHDGKA